MVHDVAGYMRIETVAFVCFLRAVGDELGLAVRYRIIWSNPKCRQSSQIFESLFGYNGSVQFPHTNDPFPSVSKRKEGHFHSRNGRPAAP